MATLPSKSTLQLSLSLERQKGNDLQKLLSIIKTYKRQHASHTDAQIVSIMQQYFSDSQQDLEQLLEQYTHSKLALILSTTAEMNRLRYLIQQLNRMACADHIDLSNTSPVFEHLNSGDHTVPASPPSRSQSLTMSPLRIPSPDIDIKPLDLDDLPPKFRPRRFSVIPPEWTGTFKIQSIAAGNGEDFPYPNDQVTVQYSMFSIDKILHLVESFKHELIDLGSPQCMVGLKTALLSMSMNQRCKIWIPQRFTAYIDAETQRVATHDTAVVVEICMLNIIRSDVYKSTTYRNDIILYANQSSRHRRTNTVSKTPPPLTPMAIPVSSFMFKKPIPESPLTLTPQHDEYEEKKTDEYNIPHRLSTGSRNSVELDAEQQPETHKNMDTERKDVKYSVVVHNVDDGQHEKQKQKQKQTKKTTIVVTAEEESQQSEESGNDLNERFPVPALDSFGGHLNHQKTDVEEHQVEMRTLIKEMNQNLSPRILDAGDDGKSEYNESDNDHDNNSEHDNLLLDISGMHSIWRKQYWAMPATVMIEQCMTLCAQIEACECTKRLLIVLKIYQSIMYNRKQRLWNHRKPHIVTDELLSMHYAITDKLKHSNCQILNDFYHCRFYHGHFHRWYEFCRTYYEENYCVYEFVKYEDGDAITYKRHCSIYQRYHRNKSDAKRLQKRREWFRVEHDDKDDGLHDEEIEEIVTLQICDMIHCYLFHSCSEPHLLYAHESLKPKSSLSSKERNIVQADKFAFSLHAKQQDNTVRLPQQHTADEYRYEAESFGVLISYKDNTYSPQYTSMQEEVTSIPTAGISMQQYMDTALRASIFQQTFIGRQMVNFFGKHINLQQIIACMLYTNFVHLQHAFSATLHCHNHDELGMEALRQSHCEQFWHWSKILFSVVDHFGDPIEGDSQFLCKFTNYKSLLLNDLNLYTECIYSCTADKLSFAKNSFLMNNTKNNLHKLNRNEATVDVPEIIAVIGAQRLGSLYFDASLLSDYPHENEVLLGPSENLEIRNLIIADYDCHIYFGAMYIMDALIGHKLSFNYAQYENYQSCLYDVIVHTLQYVEGHKALELGQKICYHYWENKSTLRWDVQQFDSNISIEKLKKFFVIRHAESKQMSFHFVNVLMLFPNCQHIEINNLELNAFLCDSLLQLIQIVNSEDDAIHCGQQLRRIQLFGDEHHADYAEFMQHLFDEFVSKFKRFQWCFKLESAGNWLFTKITAK